MLQAIQVLECNDFIRYIGTTRIKNYWSADVAVGNTREAASFNKTLCARTIYNYIDLGLLGIKKHNLPLKLRRKAKGSFIRKNKKLLVDSIDSYNVSEFSENSALEISDAKVSLTHPYSSFVRGTNERHNGLLRRFITKRKWIAGYSHEAISLLED